MGTFITRASLENHTRFDRLENLWLGKKAKGKTHEVVWIRPYQATIHRVESCEVVSSVGFDHINRNPPVPIRTPKLTRFEPAQYWGGGPPGNSVVLNPILLFHAPCNKKFSWGRSLLERLWKTTLDSTGSKPTAGQINQKVKHTKCFGFDHSKP